MSTCVCVLSNNGERLMPTFCLGKVRRLPEPQTAYMSSMPTVSSIEKIPQSAMSSIC